MASNMSALPNADLDSEHQALSRFLALAPIGLALLSLDGEILFINPVCEQLLVPFTRDRRPRNLFIALENVAPDLRRAAAQFGDRHGMVCDAVRIRSTRALSLSLLKLDRGRLMAVITELAQAPAERRRARTAEGRDSLTGLANSHAFAAAAEREIARHPETPRNLCLLLLNVDSLAAVNDAYGHAAGDALLRNLAANLVAGCREIDLAARIADDEFALLLPATALDGAFAAANRLRRTIESQSVIVAIHCFRYTVSGGVAAMDSPDANLETLSTRARQALFAAKSGGRNRIESW
jgi:diguanylate cyclase (GGDEF)-like protein